MRAMLNLTQTETAKIRRSGGTGYIGVVAAVGPRGGRYIPLRTALYVTPEGAQRELDSIRIKSSLIVTRREVVPVVAKLAQEV